MRILYVAMTRPINKLIMVASLKNLPRLASKWSKSLGAFNLGKARTFMDWAGPVLIRHPHGEILRDLAFIEPDWEEINPDTSRWQINILSPAMLSLPEQIPPDNKAAVQYKLHNFIREESSALQDLINSRLNWQYPYREAAKIPSKLSVSGIKKMQNSQWPLSMPEPPVRLEGPDFMQAVTAGSSHQLSGAERGTVMHFVMQHLDLAHIDSHSAIEEQINLMVINELLRAEEMAAVQTGKIRRFFQSQLGQRLLKSPSIHREVPFNMVIKAHEVLEGMAESDEELLLQGVIDLYFQEGDELVLVDYKTDYISPENRSELIQQYSIQLQLYKTALERILGQKVKESYLYLFHTEEEVRL